MLVSERERDEKGTKNAAQEEDGARLRTRDARGSGRRSRAERRREIKMWTKMFLRLLMQMSFGVSFEDAVKTVAASSPSVTEREVYFAAVAAKAHLERGNK